MRARLSTATSMKPQEVRSATACLKRVFQHFGEMEAVHLAGQGVELRQICEPLLLVVPLVDDADDAVREAGLAVGAGEPAADILDPKRLVGALRMQARTALDTDTPAPSSRSGDFITASKRLVAASAASSVA